MDSPPSHVAPPKSAAGSQPNDAPGSTTNIWDSAWNACTQVPPPNLTEVLGAYAQKGDGDREMLLGILKAKSAEDQRIAAVASLHQTILQLQASALQSGGNALSPSLPGGPTPTPTPPVRSPLPTQSHRRSITSYSPPMHSAPAPSYAPQHPPSSSASYFSHPTLPPISTLRTSPPPASYQEGTRKRARVSPSSSTSSNRPSPDYPLSPYSAGSGRSPRQQHHHQSSAGVPLRPAPYPPPSSHTRGRLAVSSLLGIGNEEDGDVKYRRMSAERSTR